MAQFIPASSLTEHFFNQHINNPKQKHEPIYKFFSD